MPAYVYSESVIQFIIIIINIQFCSFQRSAIFSYRLVTRSPLQMSDYPLGASCVFCDVNGGQCIQNGSP